jgi:hypothetical protein
MAEIKEKCFGVEGRVGATPGAYQLHVIVTDKITNRSFTQTRPVRVPEFHHALSMSQVMFLATENPVRGASIASPFSFSGIGLKPIGSDNIAIRPGMPLRLIFQVWEDPAPPLSLQSKKLNVTYTLGHLGSSLKREEEQVMERSSFDANGNLLIGKDISTTDLPPGNYRLAIKVSAENHETATQAISFQIIALDAFSLWTIAAH